MAAPAPPHAPAVASRNGKTDPVDAAVKAVASTITYAPEGDRFRSNYVKLTEDQRRDMAANFLLELERNHAQMCLRLVSISHDYPVYTTGNPERGERQRLLEDRTEVKRVRAEQIALLRAQMAATEQQIRDLHAHPVWGELLMPKAEPPEPDDGMRAGVVDDGNDGPAVMALEADNDHGSG